MFCTQAGESKVFGVTLIKFISTLSKGKMFSKGKMYLSSSRNHTHIEIQARNSWSKFIINYRFSGNRTPLRCWCNALATVRIEPTISGISWICIQDYVNMEGVNEIIILERVSTLNVWRFKYSWLKMYHSKCIIFWTAFQYHIKNTDHVS